VCNTSGFARLGWRITQCLGVWTCTSFKTQKGIARFLKTGLHVSCAGRTLKLPGQPLGLGSDRGDGPLVYKKQHSEAMSNFFTEKIFQSKQALGAIGECCCFEVKKCKNSLNM